MEIRILTRDYLKSDEAYTDFLNGNTIGEENYTQDNPVKIKDCGDFQFYLKGYTAEERESLYIKSFKVVGEMIKDLNREHQMNVFFWYSYLLTKKRDYILKTYPQVTKDIKEFRSIVLKSFDSKNYIYKLILGSQYVMENIKDEAEQEEYFKLIANNLDIYNYIITYEIFRNDIFLLNVLKIIDRNNISALCRKKIPYFSRIKGDERYGRRVIIELNRAYPIILSPMMTADELEPIFIGNINKYLRLSGEEEIKK